MKGKDPDERNYLSNTYEKDVASLDNLENNQQEKFLHFNSVSSSENVNGYTLKQAFEVTGGFGNINCFFSYIICRQVLVDYNYNSLVRFHDNLLPYIFTILFGAPT
jgi:hypothetical protein